MEGGACPGVGVPVSMTGQRTEPVDKAEIVSIRVTDSTEDLAGSWWLAAVRKSGVHIGSATTVLATPRAALLLLRAVWPAQSFHFQSLFKPG